MILKWKLGKIGFLKKLYFNVCFRSPKGKPSLSEPTSTPTKVLNTFSNDGSFFEQFKKLNEAKNKAAVKAEAPQISLTPKPEASPAGKNSGGIRDRG